MGSSDILAHKLKNVFENHMDFTYVQRELYNAHIVCRLETQNRDGVALQFSAFTYK